MERLTESIDRLTRIIAAATILGEMSWWWRVFGGLWGIRRYVMDQHENMQQLLTRLNNIRDSMEEALGDVRGIEDDYRRGLLEAHIRGAIREINAQITELVSSRKWKDGREPVL
jgi:hypothetical protein